MSDDTPTRRNPRHMTVGPIEPAPNAYTGARPLEPPPCGQPHPHLPGVACTIDRNHRAPRHSAITAADHETDTFTREQWA